MTTSQLVTFLKNKVNENRSTILEILDEVQRFVFSRPMFQAYYYDSTTGMPPYMATTDLKSYYEFPAGSYTKPDGSPLTVLRTIAILSWKYAAVTRANVPMQGRRKTYYLKNQFLYQIPCIQKDKLINTPANITFVNLNPGATTDTFYHLFSPEPTPLTSETIQISIPEHQHMRIRQAALMILREERYGDLTAWEYFEEKICPKICEAMNQGSQGKIGQTPLQMKDREFYHY